jgi:hypothetical protein
MSKCKNINCKKQFEKKRANQIVCSVSCAYEYTKQLKEKKDAQHWKARKKVLKDKLKTHKDYVQELQVVFNSYIRLRDKDLPCISCGRHHEGQYHAGHYMSVGSYPELRVNPLNVWKQCAPCNNHLHGNLIQYRKNLILRIGVEEVEKLEQYNEPRKYSIPELIELKVIYKDKIKNLK